ncbi:DegT/DnrJ/EryC1/StrS family aminotransferase [Alphaproteobacteria bacterium]|nr:DegT/DnrJ/EryC1/StrS family aminotransferase [Alphaproteobacteria bacterium]
MTHSVPIARTNLTEDEITSVLGPLRSGWLVQGPQVKSFEEKWCAFTGSPHSLAVTSCTTGMHLAVAALGLKPGDEVIVPAFTWISTANVIEHQGAIPVFCDIDFETFNIDVAQIEGLITERTVGIMPVHLFGLAADMDPILAIAKKYGLWVIEDAACGFGATYNGQHVGHFGNAGAFSFHPRKAITTGEGGMVTMADGALATKVQQLRDHGAVMSDLQRHLGPKPYLLADHIYAGYNQRMTDMQGALGSTQMDRAPAIIEERRGIAAEFEAAFADLDWLRTPKARDGYGHGYQSYPCLFQPEAAADPYQVAAVNAARNGWMEALQVAGVSTRPATHAVHMLSYYAEKYDLRPEDFPNARAANDCSISLPLFHGMTDTDKAHLIDTVCGTEPA